MHHEHIARSISLTAGFVANHSFDSFRYSFASVVVFIFVCHHRKLDRNSSLHQHPSISKHKRRKLNESSRFQFWSFANVFVWRYICNSIHQYIVPGSLSLCPWCLFPLVVTANCSSKITPRQRISLPDCVTSSQSNPLRNRSVLLLCLCKLLLGSE